MQNQDFSNKQLAIIIMSALGVIVLLLILNHLITLYRFIFKKSKFRKLGRTSQIRLIHQLNDAVSELAKNKIGAIITIQNKDPLTNLRTDGVLLNADISSFLLLSIFNKNSPLHDGAVIIKSDKLVYAGTFYKITQTSISNKYGARHRAALGIAEQSDALTIVVSEETGDVSFVQHGKINKIKQSMFQEELTSMLSNSQKK